MNKAEESMGFEPMGRTNGHGLAEGKGIEPSPLLHGTP